MKPNRSHPLHFLLALLLWGALLTQAHAQTSLTNGLVAYYPFNGNANDAAGTNHGTLYNGAYFTNGITGIPSRALYCDGLGAYAFMGNNDLVYPNQTLTWSIWFKTETNDAVMFSDDGWVNGGDRSLNLVSGVLHGGSAGSDLSDPIQGVIPTNVWQMATFTSSTNGQFLYLNGRLLAQSTNIIVDHAGQSSVSVGAANYNGPGSGPNNVYQWRFRGALSELRIYNRPLSPSEVAQLYAIDSGLAPPTISSPATAAATAGQPFSFQITASNTPTNYTATGLPAGLFLNASTGRISGTPTAVGTFTVTLGAGNAAGVGTQVLTLTVVPLVITASPQGVGVLLGGTAGFSVGVAGQGPFTYQWRFNGGNLTGATAAMLTVTNVQAGQEGTYSVVVGNVFGSVPSLGAVLSVITPPAIVSQPVGRTNLASTTATFTVTASGTAPLRYQWRLNGTNLPGATSSTLILADVQVTQAGLYSVVVSNDGGAVTSANAVLAVRSAPFIVTPPGARVVNAAAQVTFTVSVLGEAPFTYQWRFNGNNLAGATNGTYTLSAATPSHEGLYSVVVGNSLGSATSSAARLTVLPISVSVPWVAAGGGSGSDVGNAIAVDAAGNSYVAGYFSGTATFGTTPLTSAGVTDIFITKHDSNGQLLWARRAGGGGYDVAKGIAVDALGNCYVTGAYEGVADFSGTLLTNTSPTSYADVFLAKYDAAGNLVWVRSAGVMQATDEGTAVAVDGAGNVLVTGRSTLDTFAGAALVNSGRIFVAKYTSAGTPAWMRKAGSFSGGNQDIGTGIATDSAGNVFVTGVFYSPVAAFGVGTFTNFGSADVFLAKLDPAGTLLWTRQAGGAGEDAAGGVATAADGSAYLVGATSGSATFSGSNVTSLAGAALDGFITKYASDGSVTWVRQFGGNGLSVARGVAVDGAGTVHVTGYFSGGATFGTHTLGGISGSYDAFLTRLDANGVFAFAQQAGGADLSGDFGLGVGADAAGNSVITGYFSGTSTVGGGSLTNRGAEDVLVTRFNHFSGGGTPQVGFQRMGAQLRMRWPLAASSYILQSTTNLLAPMWLDETNALNLTGADLETDVTIGNTIRFYRLRKP